MKYLLFFGLLVSYFNVQAAALDGNKPIICELSGARDNLLGHGKMLIIDNEVFSVNYAGNVAKDGNYGCKSDGRKISCSTRRLYFDIVLESGFAHVWETNASGIGMAGNFLSLCKNY